MSQLFPNAFFLCFFVTMTVEVNLFLLEVINHLRPELVGGINPPTCFKNEQQYFTARCYFFPFLSPLTSHYHIIPVKNKVRKNEQKKQQQQQENEIKRFKETRI